MSVVGTGNGRFERTPNEGAAGLAVVWLVVEEEIVSATDKEVIVLLASCGGYGERKGKPWEA